VLPPLEQGAAPEHASPGLATAQSSNGGVQVGQVTAGGPAADAGIQAGDVVTEVDGDQVNDPDDVAQAIEDNEPGDRVEVRVERGGSEQTIEVTLGQRPEQP
jgi:putative serine protease PepD